MESSLKQAISRELKTYAKDRFHYFKPDKEGNLGSDLAENGFLTKKIYKAITQLTHQAQAGGEE